jgi:RimJ/RimL family protein N-acetyltransferase
MEAETLRSARLLLSAPGTGDVDAVHAACQDAEIQRFTTIPSPYLRDDAQHFVERAALRWRNGEEATWALRHRGELAGAISLNRLPTGAPELGFWVTRPRRGQGLVTEAARAVIDWAFSPARPGIVRIEWRAAVGNVASARAARSLGVRYEGMLRQALGNDLGRSDAWIAGLLRADDRAPVAWPVLPD